MPSRTLRAELQQDNNHAKYEICRMAFEKIAMPPQVTSAFDGLAQARTAALPLAARRLGSKITLGQ